MDNDNYINDLFLNSNNNSFLDTCLSNDINKKLYSYQIKHCQNIIHSLNKNKYALDGSDTGTGKTYTSIAACKHLNIKPFIVCPKTIINSWKNVCKYFNVKYLGIVNYETIKNGKYYVSNKGKMKRVICPYIEVDTNKSKLNKEDKLKLSTVEKKQINYNKLFRFKWKLPNNSILIFDEVHKCKDKNTYNSNLLLASMYLKQTNKLLILSATLIDKIENFKVFGYILRCYKNIKYANNWIKNTNLKDIHKQLYPNKGSRMNIHKLGSLFPKNQISANCYNIKCPQKIQKNYEKIKNIIDILKKKKETDCNNQLVDLLRARQEIEFMKIPILIDLIKDYRQNNLSIVIFVNFNQTLKTLLNELKINCSIHGEQTDTVRQKNINDFMQNKEKIIVCNIEAGGQSISLHDKIGGYQRISLICPSFKSTSLIQALGRIHRADSKSPALQRIIFCAGTVEEYICNNIKKKLNCLNELNDGDLDSYSFLDNKITFNNLH